MPPPPHTHTALLFTVKLPVPPTDHIMLDYIHRYFYASFAFQFLFMACVCGVYSEIRDKERRNLPVTSASDDSVRGVRGRVTVQQCVCCSVCLCAPPHASAQVLLALWLAYNAFVYVSAMLMMWTPSPSDIEGTERANDRSHLHLHLLLLLAKVLRIDVGEKKRFFEEAIDEAKLPQRVLRAPQKDVDI
jgi:hypothetical protein